MRITVESLNRELKGIGFHVGKCARSYGLSYFLFCDQPGFAVDEVVYTAKVAHHKPIGWRTLREARDEMLGLVRVMRRWYIRRVATGSDFARADEWSRRHPTLSALLVSGLVRVEPRIGGRDYVGTAADGTVVSFGGVEHDDQAELYLSNNPTPADW